MPRRPATLVLAAALFLTGCAQVDDGSTGAAPPPPVSTGNTVVPASPDAASAELEPMTPARLEPDCPAPEPGTAVTAAQLNRAMSRIDLPQWASADIGLTAPLADGRTVWLWGDTVRQEGVEPRMVANSMLVSSGTCFSQVVTDDARATLPDPAPGVIFWPMSVLRFDPTPAYGEGVTDVLVVLWSRVQRGARMWDFLLRGTTATVFVVGADGIPTLDRVWDMTLDTVDPNHIDWGAASAVDGDWIYVYGTRTTGEAYVYGRELYVARMPVSDPTALGALQFWDGTTWQSDQQRSAPIIDAVGGVSQTLTVNDIDGRWVATSRRGGDLFDEIYMWTSDSPTGPWESRPVWSQPAGFDTGTLTYGPLAHPDVATTPGSVLLTISRNVTDFERLLGDPQLGRPLFTEVPIP